MSDTETPHTEEPWEHEEATSGFIRLQATDSVPIQYVIGDSEIVAVVEADTVPEAEANARLIAAAGTASHELPDKYDAEEVQKVIPDLIDALDSFEARHSHAERCGAKIGYACDCGYSDIKDALDKATPDDD